MSDWGGKPLKDVIYQVMGYVDFGDFLAMRRVCTRWCIMSYKCDWQWMWWLDNYGATKGFVYSNHYEHIVCRNFPDCEIAAHYADRTPAPKVLKTVPLWQQVFTQVLRKTVKRLEKNFVRDTETKERCEQTAAELRERLQVLQPEIVQTQQDLKLIIDMRGERKRRKITISKPL